MTTLESIVSTMLITDVKEIEDPSDDIHLDGKPFRIFLSPKSESGVNIGDILTVDAYLPCSGDKVPVPVTVGSWNPVLFTRIERGNLDPESVYVYIAPFNFYKE